MTVKRHHKYKEQYQISTLKTTDIKEAREAFSAWVTLEVFTGM